MARPLRIVFEGAWYHIMNRGVNRGRLFFNDKHRYAFFHLLHETKKIYGIEIHAYCLMSNHYHLIIHTPRGNISHAMKYLNSNYARFVNLSVKRDGPLFKGRFKAVLISADDYLIRLSRYIHLNPLEAKMVGSLFTYKWSSYLSYIGKCKSPEWLTTSEIVKRFGEADFCASYRKFVELTSDEDLVDFYNSEKFQPALGCDDFRQIVDDYVKLHSLSAEIVGANRILVPPTISSIVDAVSKHFEIDPECIFQTLNAVKNPARRIAMYICRELGGYHLHEIGMAMGGVTYKCISSAVRRVRSDSRQMKLANMLINRLKSKSKTISEVSTKRNFDLEK